MRRDLGAGARRLKVHRHVCYRLVHRIPAWQMFLVIHRAVHHHPCRRLAAADRTESFLPLVALLFIILFRSFLKMKKIYYAFKNESKQDIKLVHFMTHKFLFFGAILMQKYSHGLVDLILNQFFHVGKGKQTNKLLWWFTINYKWWPPSLLKYLKGD